jgi:hypothetical protein
MVSASNKAVRIGVLLFLAVLAPFAFTTLYLAITQGRAVHSHVMHRTLEVLIACSCIPFVLCLSFSLLTRVVLAVLFAFGLYYVADGYGFWAACALFGSCP